MTARQNKFTVKRTRGLKKTKNNPFSLFLISNFPDFFQQVGSFDPYSDDPRLAIQKTWLCPLSETLTVAGTAGQVIVLQMEREPRTQELLASTVIDVVGERDGFVWKGHEALTPTVGDMRFAAGYQPTCILQLHPPAACTALALHSEWQL